MDRNELIALCQSSISSAETWTHPTQTDRIELIGRVWAYVMAGCDYLVEETETSYHVTVLYPLLTHDHGRTGSNDTISIQFSKK